MPSHPETYVAYAFTEAHGNLHKVEMPWNEPKDGEVIVKVLACGVCGSDEIIPDQVLPTGLPRVPGHEIVGQVVAVPPSEKHFKVGERVGSSWHGGHCQTCDICRSGLVIDCPSKVINGILRDGGYAEYCTLRTESLLYIPEDMDAAEVAPLLCGGMTAFNALRNVNARAGDIVAVQGVGGVGHLAIQYAHAMGFRVVAISSSSEKEELAKQLGAHHYLDSSKVDPVKALLELGGAQVVAATAPHSKSITPLLNGLKMGGTLLVLALPRDNAEISFVAMVAKRISIIGWLNGDAKDCEDTVAFSRQISLKSMVEKFPLDKAQEAYDRRATARFRPVIVP